ncbi:MAG TPA: phosphate/phosphite/phosphonate ABC transporter substrate-binding protein [Mucilaginibacter sp.]|jgi:phosphonate transport system substrate-binding protein|nr:phosphate/phosphite/phosphonate ABC transporter substrate-binding protein [Mucilaginibacter sp.]
MKIKAFVVFALLLSFLGGCKNSTDLDANGMPGRLVIAIYAGGDNPEAVKSAMGKFGAYLEKKLNMPVEFEFTTDYTAVIEAIEAKKAHIAHLSPFSYVLASQKHDITPIATLGENGKPAMYHSVIFTNPGTGINSINDLKTRAKSLTLCFADPASTSGHLIPRAYLTTIGLNPDSAFKQVIFAGSHPASVLSVASRKIDIGCSTLEYGIEKLERGNELKADQIKILWESDPIVSSPIVARNDLSKDFVKKIQGLYLNLSKDAPDIFAAYIKLYHPKLNGLSYMTVQDSMYNGLRKIARGIKDLNVGQ